MLTVCFDRENAIARLMRFLAVEGITGQERAIGLEVVKSLREIGVPDKAIRFDHANDKIPLPTQTGNLIVTLPGTHAGLTVAVLHRTSTPCRSAPGPCRFERARRSSRKAIPRWAATTAPASRVW